MTAVARRLPAIAALTALYALAIGSVDPIDLAIGAIAASIAVTVVRVASPPPTRDVLRRALAAPLFAAAVAREVVTGTRDVAALALGIRTPPAGIIAIPLEERTRTGAAVAAHALTLSPGEVLLEIDWDRRLMLVHTIDASDPDAVRARHDHLYQRYQRKVFP